MEEVRKGEMLMRYWRAKAWGLLVRLVQDRNAVLLLSIALGLAWGGGAAWAERLVLPALALVMTVSVMDITTDKLSSAGSITRPALVGVLMNYLVLTGVILGLAFGLIREKAFFTGFVIIAAVPPAVAVVPFTMFLKGDVRFSLIGNVGAYLAGLALMPLIAIAFIGEKLSSPLQLAVIAVELILVPLVVSRVLLRLHLGPSLERAKKPITNWGFFLVSYVIIALNRDVLLKDTLSLTPVFFIAFATTILLGWVIEACGKLLGLKREKIISVVLLGTLKNYGLAGGLALTLFDKPSAVPATVASVFMVAYIIYLELVMRRREKEGAKSAPKQVDDEKRFSSY
jgi:bile acid:Na+ symporter, BASS family